MKKMKFDSIILRAILFTVVCLMILGFGIGFYFAQGFLNETATAINQKTTQLSQQKSTQAQNNLMSELTSLKPIQIKASSLTTSEASFVANATTDLSNYASKTGIQVEKVEPSQLPVGSNVSNVNGVQARYVKVTLKNPVPFNNLMKFIKAIETNIPKMRLTGISLGHNVNIGNSVTVEPLILEVYIK